MSQAGILNITSGSLPPTVPTSFTTDSGTAVPALNILSLTAIDSSTNNDNGIFTQANPNLSKFLQVVLSNRATGQITTSDATVTTIITLPLGATPGVFTIFGYTTGFIPASSQGGSYDFVISVKTDGVTATEIGSEFAITFEDALMGPSDISSSTSGNNLLVEVVGVAGLTINWDSKFEYRRVT